MSLSRYLSKLAALIGSDGKVPTSALADGAVTNAKMASGAAVANIGFTPPNLAYVKNAVMVGSYTNGTWYPVWTNSDITASGVYVIDFYLSTQYAGGNLWSWNGVTAPFYYYAGGTNSSLTANLTVHQQGHAGTDSVALRTRTNYNNVSPYSVVIEMSYNGGSLSGINSTNGKEGYFYIRKLY